jgi:hypothetical protein
MIEMIAFIIPQIIMGYFMLKEFLKDMEETTSSYEEFSYRDSFRVDEERWY